MKIKFTLLLASGIFILGVMVLVVAQYMIARSVRELIGSNQALLSNYEGGFRLSGIEKDLLVLDSRLKEARQNGDSADIQSVRALMGKLKRDMIALRGSSVSPLLLAQLDSLVERKLLLEQKEIDLLGKSAKARNELLDLDEQSTEISLKIDQLVHAADTSGRTELVRNIAGADRSGQKLMYWTQGVALLGLLLLSGLFLFVMWRLRKQTRLVELLNRSEQKLKQAVQVKENFLANMSHEIRTPLNAILGYTHLLQKKKLDEEARLYVATVQQSGETLLTVVNDILDISKIESGMMHLEENPFSLEGLLHSVVAMFRQKAEEKGLVLQTIIEPHTPDLLLGDATRLTQILINLLGNAIKFTERGSVLLNVAGDTTAAEQVEVIFEVIDTGIGISPLKLETVFERFRQAEDSTTRQYGGTGLGLSIVRDLVQLQRGDIHVVSDLGAGTTVRFSIPYRQSPPLQSPVAFQHAHAPQPLRLGLRVLVAEDNEINRGLIDRMLRQWSIECTIADNGREAVELLQAQPFDLVFMDIQMPIMDGYTATTKIREDLQLDIPVIAMTAHAMAGDREKCLSYGMNDHIAKPLREKDLLRILQEFTQQPLAAPPVLNHEIPQLPKTYHTIDLHYMRDISQGDTEYEKLVTSQFLTQMPMEMSRLQKSYLAGDMAMIRRVAHNMKTTVSIMGLDFLLSDALNALEEASTELHTLARHIELVLEVGRLALGEAEEWYVQLSDTLSEN